MQEEESGSGNSNAEEESGSGNWDARGSIGIRFFCRQDVPTHDVNIRCVEALSRNVTRF
jgi:hypothetical protein